MEGKEIEVDNGNDKRIQKKMSNPLHKSLKDGQTGESCRAGFEKEALGGGNVDDSVQTNPKASNGGEKERVLYCQRQHPQGVKKNLESAVLLNSIKSPMTEKTLNDDGGAEKSNNVVSFKRKVIDLTEDGDEVRVTDKDSGVNVTPPSRLEDETGVKACGSCHKRQRVENDMRKQEFCSCSLNLPDKSAEDQLSILKEKVNGVNFDHVKILKNCSKASQVPCKDVTQDAHKLNIGKDVIVIIKKIKKKCRKKLTKLQQKGKAKKAAIVLKYEEERKQLERKKMTELVHIRIEEFKKKTEGAKSSSNIPAKDALKNLDIEFAKSLERIIHEKDIMLKNLEAMIEVEEKKVRDKEASWMEEVSSWLSGGLLHELPSDNCLQINEQVSENGGASDTLENDSSNKSSSKALPDECSESVRLTETCDGDASAMQCVLSDECRQGAPAREPVRLIETCDGDASAVQSVPSDECRQGAPATEPTRLIETCDGDASAMQCVPSDECRQGAPATEPLVQTPQTVSIDVPSGCNSNSSSTCEVETQPTSGNNAANQITQAPYVVENHVELSDLVPLPATSLSSSPIDELGTSTCDPRMPSLTPPDNNLTVQNAPARIMQPMYFPPPPLQVEFERLWKKDEETIKAHEDAMLQLKSNFEKEVAEIIAKYEIKHKEMETVLLAQRRELHENLKMVEINMHLANAFRAKYCNDPEQPNAVHQGLSRQMTPLQSQQFAQMPSTLVGSSSSGPPPTSVTSLPVVSPCTGDGPAQTTHYSSASISSTVSMSSLSSVSSHVGDRPAQTGHPFAAPSSVTVSMTTLPVVSPYTGDSPTQTAHHSQAPSSAAISISSLPNVSPYTGDIPAQTAHCYAATLSATASMSSLANVSPCTGDRPIQASHQSAALSSAAISMSTPPVVSLYTGDRPAQTADHSAAPSSAAVSMNTLPVVSPSTRVRSAHIAYHSAAPSSTAVSTSTLPVISPSSGVTPGQIAYRSAAPSSAAVSMSTIPVVSPSGGVTPGQIGYRSAAPSSTAVSTITLPVVSPYIAIRPAHTAVRSAAPLPSSPRTRPPNNVGLCTPPHLRPFRAHGVVKPSQIIPSSPSATSPLRPHLPNQTPSQTVPRNPSTTSPLHPRPPAQTPSQTSPKSPSSTSPLHPLPPTKTP